MTAFGLSNDSVRIANKQACVHSASRNEFVTIYARKSEHEEDVGTDWPAGGVKCSITIGHRDTPMRAIVQVDGDEVLKDFYIYKGEEIWLSVDQPKSIVVYGVARLGLY